MIKIIYYIMIFLLFSCSSDEEMLSFDKKKEQLVLSQKLKGRILYISEKTSIQEHIGNEIMITITKTIYNTKELSIKRNKMYTVCTIYSGRGYCLDIYLK